jgi:hypothetical protein
MLIEGDANEVNDIWMIELAHYQCLHHKISFGLRRGEKGESLHRDRIFLIPSVFVQALENLTECTLT